MESLKAEQDEGPASGDEGKVLASSDDFKQSIPEEEKTKQEVASEKRKDPVAPPLAVNKPVSPAEPTAKKSAESKLQKYEHVKDTKLFQKFLAKEKDSKQHDRPPKQSHLPPAPAIIKEAVAESVRPATEVRPDPDLERAEVQRSPKPTRETPPGPDRRSSSSSKQRSAKKREAEEPREDTVAGTGNNRSGYDKQAEYFEEMEESRKLGGTRKGEISMMSNDQELFGVSEQVPFNAGGGSYSGEPYQPMVPPRPAAMSMYAPPAYPMMSQVQQPFMNPSYPIMGYPPYGAPGPMQFAGGMFAPPQNPYMLPPQAQPKEPAQENVSFHRSAAASPAKEPALAPVDPGLKDEVKRLQEELRETKIKYETLKSTSTSSEDVEGRIKEVEQKWEEKLKRREMEAKSTAELMKGDIEALQKRNEELSKKRQTEVAKKDEEAGKLVTELKAQLKERDDQIGEMNEELAKARKAAEQMRAQVADLTRKEATLRAAGETRDQQIAEFKQQVEELMKENTAVTGQKDQLENAKFVLTSKLEKQTKQCEQLKQELVNYKDQLAETEQRESLGRDKIDKLAAEIGKFQLQNNKLGMQLYAKEESISALQQQMNTLLGSREEFVQRPYTASVASIPRPSPATGSGADQSFDLGQRSPMERDSGRASGMEMRRNVQQRTEESPREAPVERPRAERVERAKEFAPVRREARGERARELEESSKVREVDSPKERKDAEKREEPAPRSGSGYQQQQKEILLPSQQRYEDKIKVIHNIENKLLSLQLEKKKLDEEYAKIVDKGAKTNAQRRRKDDLELELSILNKNVSSLKQKLRDMNAINQEY